MDAIDRRDVLRALLCGAVAASLGASLLPGSAGAMPLAMQKDPGKKAGSFTHEAQAVATRPPPRPIRIPGAVIIIGGGAVGSARGTEDVATVDGDGGDDH